MPHCLIWCIWRERNACCFEGCERSLLEIKSFFLHTLLVWSVDLSHFSCFSLSFLLDHCNFGSWFFAPPVHPQCTRVGYFFFLIKFICYLSKKKKFPPSLTFQSPWVQSISRGHVPLVKPTTYLTHVMWAHDMGLGFIRIKSHDALRDPQGSSSLKMEFYLSDDEVPYLIAFRLYFFFFFMLLLLVFWFRA